MRNRFERKTFKSLKTHFDRLNERITSTLYNLTTSLSKCQIVKSPRVYSDKLSGAEAAKTVYPDWVISRIDSEASVTKLDMGKYIGSFFKKRQKQR